MLAQGRGKRVERREGLQGLERDHLPLQAAPCHDDGLAAALAGC